MTTNDSPPGERQDEDLTAGGSGPGSSALRRRLAAARRRAAPALIPRRAGGGPIPLTAAQERLWVLDRFAPGAALYQICRMVRLAGRLDAAALAAALAAIARRHETLRARLAEDAEGRPQLEVHPAGESMPLPRVDLSALPGPRGGTEAHRLARNDGRRPFDAERERRLWRATLLALGAQEHRLVLAFHHVIFDGWSMRVLVGELSRLYRVAVGGAGESPPPLPIQFGDYAAWEREELAAAAPALRADVEYWRPRLAGLEPLDLPADRPLPAVRRWSGGVRGRRLSPEAAAAVERLARDHGGSLFMVLIAAYQVVLGRTAGSRDVAVGFPVANRSRQELEGLIGFFVNTLVLRTDLGGDPTGAELLARVREATLDALEHQRLPFARLVQEVAPGRPAGRASLVQALFTLDEGGGGAPDLPGLTTAVDLVDRGTTDADLVLAVERPEGGLHFHLVYSRERFAETTAERLLRHLEAVLLGMAAAPAARLSALPPQSAAERQQVLVEWADTAAGYPRGATVHDLFAVQARRRPDAVAVAWEGGSLTYAELDRRARALAAGLRRRGVGPGTRVAVALPRGPELITALLAILRAGGAFAPLDLDYPAERLAWMAADLGAPVVVGWRRRLAELALALPAGTAVVEPAVAAGTPPEGKRSPAVDPPLSADAPAYVMYTSGSTGRPKGVLVPHRAVTRLVVGSRFARWGEERVWAQLAPASFDASTVEIWGALLHGGRLALAPPEAMSLAELGGWLARLAVDSLWLTAGLFHPMVEHQLVGLAGLAQLLAGGDVLSLPYVARVTAELPRLALVNGYGPTENTTFTCCHRMGGTTGAAAAGLARRSSVPIGRPVANTRVHVVDAAGGPVPAGVVGELWAGGDGVALGYLERPRATAERFTPDPWGPPGSRVYRTGDLVRWLPGGEVEFVGRRDGQVKVRGFRVELGELEAAVGSHPGVATAAVVAVAPADGAADRRLVAFWVGRGEAAPATADLRAHLERRVPEFMLPAALVRRDGLPLTANGKVDRRALAGEGAAALRGEGGGEGAAEFTAPRDEVEKALAAQWAELLERPRIGAHDDFFAIGGHSLLAARAIARARALFGVELALHELFAAPTVAGLAAAVRAARERGAAAAAGAPSPAPAPESDGADGGDEHETSIAGPTSETETRLAALWAELFGRRRVGIDDDFFGLGGHSVLALRLIAGVRDRFAVDLPLRALFEAPTVGGLAAAIDAASPIPATVTARAGPVAAGGAGAPVTATDPTRSAPPRTFPLSLPQQRLWFLDRLEPGGAAYSIPLALRLRGRLDVPALAGALAEIERRHEALRTTFGTERGEPVQRVGPPRPARLPVVDLAGLPDPREAARAVADAEAQRPFDLERGPVSRAVLLRPDGREHLLVVVQHHIVSDGWSLGIWCRELAALYDAFVAGKPSPLPEPGRQYGDFALDQRRRERETEWADQLAFWKRRLAGVEPLELPADRPPRTSGRPGGTPAGAGVRRTLTRLDPAGLAALARRLGATPFMVAMAVFQALLGRHTGQRRFTVGVPVAGRPRPEWEAQIGFFVNTVVVSADLGGEPTFEALLARVREETSAALAHQDVPFERVVAEVKPERVLGRTPLFQVALTFRGEAVARPLAGLEVELRGLHGGQAPFDLTLSFGTSSGDGSRLDALFEYDATRFDPTTVARLAGHFESLLAAAAADPGRRLGELSLASPAERHQLLVEWAGPGDGAGAVAEGGVAGTRAGSGADSDGGDVIADLAAQVRRRPEAVALSGPGTAAGGRGDGEAGWALTYGELDRRVGRLARRLRRRGVGAERPVGVWMDRRPELVIALLAVLRAGGAFVVLDPTYPRERLDRIAADAGLELILAAGTTGGPPAGGPSDDPARGRARDLAGSTPGGVPVLDVTRRGGGDRSRPAPRRAGPPPAGRHPAALAYVLYTSGSTGRPKGVGVSRGALATHCRRSAAAYGIGPGDRVLHTASFSFDVALEQLLPPLVAGAEVVLAEEPWSPREMARRLVRLGVTALDLPTGFWREWVEGAPPGSPPAPALRVVTVGGEAMPAAPAAAWAATPMAPARLVNAYGPTETTITAAVHPVVRPVAGRRGGSGGGAVAIGRALGDRHLYVVGARGEALPLGAAGELAVGGPLLARGYLGRPAATAASFIPDPFADAEEGGGRLYRTGDRVRWQGDGTLAFLGRIDHQIKLRGFRIEPGEVERTLAEHPAVAECAVALAPAPSAPGAGGGAAGARLAAWVVVAPQGESEAAGDAATDSRTEPGVSPATSTGSRAEPGVGPAAATGSAVDAGALRSFLAGRLPPYMVPDVVVFLPALPRLPGGKIDRRALPAPAPAAPPDTASSSSAAVAAAAAGSPAGTGGAGEGAAPRGRLEREVAAVWRELLGRERVGIFDNFFDLGGTSLALMRLQGRLADRFGTEPTLVELFAHPTVAAQAALLGGDGAAETAGSEPPAPERRPAGQVRPVPSGWTGELEDGIAIVGMAGRFPGASDVDELWRLIRDGREAITFAGREELAAAGVADELLDDPGYVPARGTVDGIDLFDAAFFGVNPREAALLDPQQRLFLEVAWEALERAGHPPAPGVRRIGVFAGTAASHYFLRNLLPNASLMRTVGLYHALSLNEKDTLPTYVSYKLDLTGPSVAVQTACSTSLVAVHLAAKSLLAGECDLALAGGVTLAVPARGGYLFRRDGILSPDGHCRAFAADAAGTVPGAGVGLVVLRRLADALADGDSIAAVLRGTALNNDGAAKVGFTAPSVDGQAEVIAAAHAAAGIEAGSVTLIEAHGTGTALGDPIEVAALTRAFRAASGRRGFCALGSVKANLGHLDAAAGVAGLIKVALALAHGEIPPALHAERPNPDLRLDEGPFYLPAERRAWKRDGGPRRAGVSSFGIGGTNVHAVLEEAPEPDPAAAAGEAAGGTSSQLREDLQLVVLSARSAAALGAARVRLAGHLEAHPALALADVAFTLQAGRRAFAHRAFAVCRDRAGALAALAAQPGRLVAGSLPRWGEARPTVAFLFPGQGAQAPGMGAELYAAEPVFRAEVDRCAELLAPTLGFDLRRLLYPAADADRDEAARRLADTAVAQPALFVTSWALARLWMSWGIEPEALAGHSIGEYAAACLAGVFPLPDALELVAERGRMMAARPPGAMLAVRLPPDELEAELAALSTPSGSGPAPPELSVAAINEPAAAVASGPREAIDRLAERLRERGAACRPLAVSHAFHSPMMDPVVEPFRRRVAEVDLHPPRLPLVSNRSGDWLTAAEAADPAYWAAQLRGTVRWADSVARLAAEPERVFLEVGPGRALTGFVRRHPDVAPDRAAVASLAERNDPGGEGEAEGERAALRRALGRLWLAGVEPDWPAVHAPRHPRRVPLPTYPFERRRFWIDPPPPTAASAGDAADPLAALDESPLPSPDHDRPDLPTGFVPPRDDLETAIAAIWQDLLGLRTVGVEDDFLDLGGDSLLATQVTARLRVDLAADLSVATLFESRTVAGLARAVQQARASIDDDLAPAEVAEALRALEGLTEAEIEALLHEGDEG